MLAVALVGYRWFSSERALFVHLSCNGEISGKLIAAIIKKNCESVKSESFDVGNICKAGKFQLSGYDRDKRLQFTPERGNGENIKIISEYGSDIMRDQNQFNLIVKLTDATPFIANDRL